ncbi:hypothetical protein DOM21_14525 [Bacteriovorax stolpii]|uniref:Activator of Hsp90 ATPase homologue 1/2-like C-terminal domain-containing protein n=1 Tax=Bacteriovorax stolpii TaxID=960 RepID=A0A2K9NPG2_BACTC|nr:SRPBCC family protein [Bacteriovorax stolpii]AUN97388.1 hypothetical protein C0V70_04530 [Bacteriovorax stolpii]QDK42642.1 hypothetical protein DOM21_14525 [Bacteriovorax stolpii]TDP52561.1 uncharacterized protein YndB with AHSA1/START domain [Bacteriovorax stolpii]
MSAKNKPNEIYIERIYDAPVKIVWEAWTDPDQVAKWWGPRGFTHTTKSKDFRPGGKWIYTMHGPDGVDWPNITTYHEIIPYSRLMYDHGGNEERDALFRVTVNFIELKNDKTKMEMWMAFPDPEAAKEIGKHIRKAGGNATWDRLAEHLEKRSSGKEKFVINRTFEAPIALVFDMFTKPEHFTKWLAPTGMDMVYLKNDIKVGDYTICKMSDAQGFTLYNKAQYKEITQPNRIVYTQEFCDEKGNITKAPFDPNWPTTMQTTVTLIEENPTLTRVTVSWELVGDFTQIELETFIKEKGGMTVGWTGSFDKLEEYLKNI